MLLPIHQTDQTMDKDMCHSPRDSHSHPVKEEILCHGHSCFLTSTSATSGHVLPTKQDSTTEYHVVAQDKIADVVQFVVCDFSKCTMILKFVTA